MSGRYEISAPRWAMIEHIVSPPQRMGRPRRDDRRMLNGIFWILCSGAKWRDLPERYGPWKTVYQRFRQWRDGTLHRTPPEAGLAGAGPTAPDLREFLHDYGIGAIERTESGFIESMS